MEEMKTYRAPLWFKNRIGEQVIEINQVCGHHDSAVAFPLRLTEKPGNREWSEEMTAVVEDRLEELYVPIQLAKKLW